MVGSFSYILRLLYMSLEQACFQKFNQMGAKAERYNRMSGTLLCCHLQLEIQKCISLGWNYAVMHIHWAKCGVVVICLQETHCPLILLNVPSANQWHKFCRHIDLWKITHIVGKQKTLYAILLSKFSSNSVLSWSLQSSFSEGTYFCVPLQVVILTCSEGSITMTKSQGSTSWRSTSSSKWRTRLNML